MKRMLLIAALLCAAVISKADQLAYITKEQAKAATEFIKQQAEVVLWCACCDNDGVRVMQVTNVYYKYTGVESFYQVVLVGSDYMDTTAEFELDLAYVHYRDGDMAYNVGKALGLSCDPCTNPFEWPTAGTVTEISVSDSYGSDTIIMADGEFMEADFSEGYADSAIVEDPYYVDPAFFNSGASFMDSAVRSWTGIYESDNGFTLNITGPDEDGALAVELSKIDEKCAEYFVGQAFLTKANMAVYTATEGTCHLNFQFGEEIIEILESGDCEHGAQCGNFEGTYKLKK